MFGWVGKIIRVDLTRGTVKTESLDMRDAGLYAGGRGLGTKICMNEVNPKTDPLSPDNKLIFITGPLTGTLAAGAGGYEAVAKSPLTGTIEAGSAGGHFGPELKFAGYDGIILEGRAGKPAYLYISDGRIELRDACRLWGSDVPAAADELAKETDEDAEIAFIGPAGEQLVPFAAILSDKSRTAGRPGPGAVMGSKNLKAIAVRGTKSIRVAKPKEFLDSCMKARNRMKAAPAACAGLPACGCITFPGLSAVPHETDPLTARDNAAALKISQDLTAAADSVGIWLLNPLAVGLPEIAEMFRTCTGLDCTDEEVLKIGERTWNLERIVHLKNGFAAKGTTLPPGFLMGSVTRGPAKGRAGEPDNTLSEYYAARGWDSEGAPTEAKKKELSIP